TNGNDAIGFLLVAVLSRISLRREHVIALDANPLRIPGESRDPFRPWIPACAGKAGCWVACRVVALAAGDLYRATSRQLAAEAENVPKRRRIKRHADLEFQAARASHARRL